MLIEVKNLNYNYFTTDGIMQTLKDISFSVEQEEIISIVGPSGCGKTTLLKIIAGLISIEDRNSISNKDNMTLGYMFQKDNLFEWLTVKENIELGLKIQKKLTENNRSKINNLMKRYNLVQFEKYYPNQISGGMRQKVALIRTLAIEPDLLLLDEPFSALDYQNRLKICDEIFNIIKEELSKCMIIKEETIGGTKVYKVRINDNDVLFVNSGITKVDFTRNFANVIGKYPVTKVIGIGNAASLDDCLKIGEVGICSNSLQYDVDFTKLEYEIAEIPELNKSIFYSDNLVKIAKEASEKECIGYSIGRTISADRFVSNTREAEELKRCFEADVLDTECGILGELSYLYCIPIVTVKGISNYGNDCAAEDYERYRCIANQKSLQVALTMMELMCNS